MERLLKDSVFARSSFQGLGEFITLPGSTSGHWIEEKEKIGVLVASGLLHIGTLTNVTKSPFFSVVSNPYNVVCLHTPQNQRNMDGNKKFDIAYYRL